MTQDQATELIRILNELNDGLSGALLLMTCIQMFIAVCVVGLLVAAWRR